MVTSSPAIDQDQNRQEQDGAAIPRSRIRHIYGEGISKEGDLIDLGVAQNLVEKSGAWYSFKGEPIGQGTGEARQFMKDNADARLKLDTECESFSDVPCGNGRRASDPAPTPAVAAARKNRPSQIKFLFDQRPWSHRRAIPLEETVNRGNRYVVTGTTKPRMTENPRR